MKEQDLIDLGFVREDDKDNGAPYHYYTLDIGNDYVPMCVISNANDEAGENNWTVSIFDYESIEFTSLEDVKNLISLLKDNVKSK